ncbi:putative monooxygenase [Aspergillus nidulans FGSC A4]|uniref:Monooxygenase, putative (AFU_orthologue AFUA_7G06960) n=1 Tax=Emericella nidulans (strain FGSC A4 / ATCC 38163 / CBS 112.46 / NRRL 194 / M139) TaxID=227321 RepID=C8VB37_EMENI|nr:hypothetical protein [Aspergillus nidulans FGSC A4]CBF79156.1 TPA: monooxygenase, putative (AFU_orthologue; AFUA_7G06960) [Aspergillus nidulans FGSC A4]
MHFYRLPDIGVLHFHRGNFRQPTFMNFDITVDWAEQAVSNNITQFQPNYEREIRNLIAQSYSHTCEVRTGCEAIACEERDDHSIVEYIARDGSHQFVRTAWLVGADGKRGVVRKRFLEPQGIRQVDGFYKYVGTWVAANLHITIPTPQSHPEFPLWRLGYTPQEVHDAFWPSGFHFCNSSSRPAVSGRFGPPNSGFWRHEYSVEPDDALDDVEEGFWRQFGPWTKVPGSQFSKTLRNTLVEFPRDCIRLIRCRPFTFATKIVNRWFSRRTMLIGDAAHVFPPFGGQGIAAGIRDAQSLSWRLALMSNLGVSVQLRERILEGWSQERRHAWNSATLATKLNGSIVNDRSLVSGWIYRVCMRVVWLFPCLARWRTRRAFRDKLIYNARTCPDGFFLEQKGGGRKVAQVWVRRRDTAPVLSDTVFLRNLPRLGLIVFVRSVVDAETAVGEVDEAIYQAGVSPELLTTMDVTYYCLASKGIVAKVLEKLGLVDQTYYPCREEELKEEGISPIRGYCETAVQDRYPSSTKYVLMRPDFFVHSLAANGRELRANLQAANEYFSDL